MLRRVKKYLAAGIVAAAPLFTVLAPGISHAAAYTCTWTGGGSDKNFSTAANWSGCNSAAPVATDDDALVIDTTNLTEQETLTNDISGLQVGSMTISGQQGIIIAGSAITLDGDITDSSEGTNFMAPLVLGTDVTVTGTGSSNYGVDFGAGGSTTINTAGHQLSFVEANSGAGCGFNANAVISGGGSIVLNAPDSGLVLNGAGSTFSGSVTATKGMLAVSGDTLNSSSGVTINDGGSLALNGNTASYNFPLSLTGSGSGTYSGTLAAYSNGIGFCGGGGTSVKAVSFAGPVTLNSDVTYSGDADLTLTGTYTANGHKFSVLAGESGTITTPDGKVSAPVQTVTVNSGDNQPSTDVSIGTNQTYIIDGQRGTTNVFQGGVLKGTGTVGGLYVNAGGTVAPGHSPGCLSTGNLQMDGTYQAEIGGTDPCTGYDQLKVTGTVSISGTLQASLYGGFVPKVGQSYTIISNDGSDAVTDTFSGIAEGGSYTNDGVTYSVTYKGGDGNDVVLTVTSIDASKLPKTPNTGMRLVAAHPAVSMGLALLAAGIFFTAARRQKAASRR